MLMVFSGLWPEFSACILPRIPFYASVFACLNPVFALFNPVFALFNPVLNFHNPDPNVGILPFDCSVSVYEKLSTEQKCIEQKHSGILKFWISIFIQYKS